MPTEIVRMLETLQHAGYVVRLSDRAAYTTTARTLALSLGYAPQRELAAVAAPIMAALNEEVGWPSDLAVHDGEVMLVVQTSRGEGRLSFNRAPRLSRADAGNVARPRMACRVPAGRTAEDAGHAGENAGAVERRRP